MASLTGQLVAETYKALLKLIDNDILTASEKQITDGFGGGSNVFIDSQGFLRANKYKVTNGLATQFLKADGSLDSNAYLTSITGAQVITALGYTPVPTTRTITINGETHNLAADNSWTVGGTAAIWGNITGTLSNQTDLQNALNAKYNNPTGTISQYIRGDGTLATFPTMPGGLPTGGSAGQILAKIDATDYNTQWIDNYATQTKNDVKLGQTLTKGTPVYVSSANGTNIIVSRASNTSEALSSKTFGLLESGGATNDIVKCVTFGLIAGLDTSTAQAGDPVWLGVNGALIFGLANKPYAPAHLVYIGVVTRVQQNNGEIFVNIQNGFELKEIHDVYIADPANNHGLFYDIADGLWKNKSIAGALGYTPQAQLSGIGFVKASGTTITYDNSTYLTTTDAASTYQRLDKMVSNLLPSATEYPNSNAVIAALALKADAANPVFTGNMTISGAEPKLYFTDTDQNPDYFIGVDAGFFRVYDQTAGATRFVINSDGNISTGVGKSITAGSFIKDGGTATQFLKADGSVDSTVYATSASLANYLLIATAASTYQTLANLSTDLTTSATKYPSVNAVNAGLATKQPLDADLTAIAALTGTTGFLKKTAADTWTLDTNTYLTTGDASTTYLAITTAASTYQRLDKMVSNLLPSSTEYPNSNAVINALALKANAANPVFTGDLSISGATPRLYFVDTDQNPDYTVFIDSGYFYIYDQTAGATRFSINSSGNINTGVGKSITAGSFIKESGTASQFLMADGSVSTFAGVTGSGTTNYIPKWTSASGLGNSLIFDDGINVGIGLTTSLLGRLSISSGNFAGLRIDTNANYNAINIGGTGLFVVDAPNVVGGRFLIFDNGNTSIGSNTDSGFKFFVNGSAKISTSVVSQDYRFEGSGYITYNTNNVSTNTFTLRNYGTTVLGFNTSNEATFASSIISNGTIFANTVGSNIRLRGGNTNSLDGFVGATSDGTLYFRNWAGTYGLVMAPTSGNASFTGSIQSGGSIIIGSNGIYQTGSIYSDSSWGMIFRAKQASPTNAEYRWARSDDSDLMRISPSGGLEVGFTATIGSYKLDVAGQMRAVSGNPLIVSMSSNVANDAVVSALWQGGTGVEMRYYPSQALCYFDSTYPATSNQVFGDIRFRVNSGGTMTPVMTIKSNNLSVGIGVTTPGAFLHIKGQLESNYGLIIEGTYGTGHAYGWRTNGGNSDVLSLFSVTLNSRLAVFGYSEALIATGGSTRFYISGTGNVGFGTTSPSTNFHILGFRADPIIFATASAVFYTTYRFNTSTDVGYIGNGSGVASGASGSDFGFQSVNNMVFASGGGGESMRLTTSKNLLVGRTSDSGERIQVTAGNATAIRIDTNANYNAINIGGYGNISVDYPGIGGGRFYLDGGGALTIRQSMTATSFFESSDLRKKKLIEHNPIIAGIENLQCKLYEKDGKIELGYFAQDAELIMPYAVTKNADGFLNLSYREVHTAKIARLEQRVAELEKQLNIA